MDDLIRLVEAMGFWGWAAVMVCTGIVVGGIVEIKKYQLKMMYKSFADNEADKKGPKSSERVEAGRDALHVQSSDGESVTINRKGIHVIDGNTEVNISAQPIIWGLIVFIFLIAAVLFVVASFV